MNTAIPSVELFPGITYDMESKNLRLSDTEFEYYGSSKSVLCGIINRTDDVLRFHDARTSNKLESVGIIQSGAEISLCSHGTPVLSVGIVNVQHPTAWEPKIKAALLPKHADSSPTDEQWDAAWAVCDLMREADRQYQALKNAGVEVSMLGPSILYDLAELCPKLPQFWRL